MLTSPVGPVADRSGLLPYGVRYSAETEDWHVLAPLGGAICRARSEERAREIARSLAAGLRGGRDGRDC
jgi:hypothetical protein